MLGTARVYNLAVEDVHEYIANGVVVHNCAWADELAAWKYPDTWAMLMLGLRLGRHPRVAVTTTPRPIRIIRELVAAPTTAVTRGTTYENLANLAPSFREQILARYEGTRLARQELHAEILEDVPGAIFTLALIDAHRVSTVPLTRRLAPDRKGWIEEPDLVRVVVAVDPSASEEDDEGADEAGIVVVGQSSDGHAYVLADRSCRASPDGWGRRAVAAYHEFGADRIVAEQNNGGAMVTHVLRTVDPTVPVKLVVASRGKRVRAEPVAALFEQGKVHMVGAFGPLEDQLCTWTPDAGKHDDRMDALVWGVSELVLEPERRKLRFRGAA